VNYGHIGVSCNFTCIVLQNYEYFFIKIDIHRDILDFFQEKRKFLVPKPDHVFFGSTKKDGFIYTHRMFAREQY
jgi:hypothetical protein